MARKSKYMDSCFNSSINDTTKWNAALYLRISREDGDKAESNSISNQKDFLSYFVEHKNDILVYDTYSDDGFTGSNFNRPDFNRMLADIEKKKINCVIVKDLSRFGREKSIVAHYLEQYFPTHDIRFIAINDTVDSYINPDSVHDMVVAIKNVMNDNYCLDTSKKVKSALDMKRRKGEFIGNYAPYGYLKNPENHHKLIVDTNVSSVVKDIFSWFVNGYNLSGIAKKLNALKILSPAACKVEQGISSFNWHSNGKPCSNLWSITSIRRILTDEVYIGNLVQGQYKNKSYKIRKLTTVEKSKWITVENTHDAIISKDSFLQVQHLLKMATRTAPKKKQVYPLAGLINCADCGYGMCRKTTGKYVYYVCSVHKLDTSKCPETHSIREDKVINIILKTLQTNIRAVINMDDALQEIKNKANYQKNYQKIESVIDKNKKELEKWKKRKLELYDDFKEGLITTRDEYDSQVGRHDEKITSLEVTITQLQQEYVNLQKQTTDSTSFIETFKRFRNITKLDRNTAVTLIKEIRICKDKTVEIDFNFMDEFGRLNEFVNENAHLCSKKASA